MVHPTPTDQIGQVAQFTSHSPRINEIKLLRAAGNYDTSATATVTKNKEYSSTFGEDDGMTTMMMMGGDSYSKRFNNSDNSFQQADRQKQVRSSVPN